MWHYQTKAGELMTSIYTKAIFVSKRMLVNRITDQLKDMVLGHMAQDIEIAAKMRVPVSNTKASGNKRGGGGHLQSSIYHTRSDSGHIRVLINKDYASYQERGARRDGSHVVKNYSTPGTGKHFFIDSINKTLRRRDGYISEARRALDL
jgi:hypothetical protein